MSEIYNNYYFTIITFITTRLLAHNGVLIGNRLLINNIGKSKSILTIPFIFEKCETHEKERFIRFEKFVYGYVLFFFLAGNAQFLFSKSVGPPSSFINSWINRGKLAI